MSLSRLSGPVRRRLRWHGWVIVLVCLATGWACSAALWRGLGVSSMGGRYGASAGVMYAVLLLCLRIWLDWVRRDAIAHLHYWQAATLEEEASHRRDTKSLQRSTERSGSMFEWGLELLSFDEAALLLLVPAVVVLLLGLLGLAVQLPLWTTEGLAALLAELLLPLLVGGAVMRRTLRRAPPEVPWVDLLGSTWWIGILLVALAALVGAGLQWADPELVTVRGLLGG